MAKRAKERAKKEASREAKLAKNPGDLLIAQTLDRIKAINKKAEEQDLALQEAFNNLFNPQKQTAAYGTGSKGLKKYSGGTNSLGVLKPEDEDEDEDDTGMYLNKSLITQTNDPYNILNVVNPVSIPASYNRTIIPDIEGAGTEIVGAKTSSPVTFEKTDNLDSMGSNSLSEKGLSKISKPKINYTPGMTYGDVVGLTGQAISTSSIYEYP